MRRLGLPLLLVFLAGLAPAAPGAEGSDGPLFSAAAAPVGRAGDAHARRERFVTVDSGVLLGAEALTLNLFPDTVLTGVPEDLQRRGPGEFTWLGRVGMTGTAVLSVRDGAVVGRIADRELGTFTVSPVGGGVHAVVQVDPASYLVEADFPVRPAAAGPVGEATRQAAGETRVTVLVVYTPAAAAGLGGVAGAEALAANVVAETNQAYQDSGVVHRLELVGAREAAYGESSQSRTNLERLTQEGDGYLDEVHAWRDEAAADLVMLVTAPMANACGSAWIMVEADPSFARQAFGVVSYDCAVGNLSFAHETGHLFGANHEPREAGQAIYPYAYAYVDCANGFRTVMAYGTECAGPTTRVARFSSPDHPYQGFPAGDDLHDNSRTLNGTAPVVARFRHPPAVCAGRTATIEGTDGPETLEGTAGADVIHGLGGDDTINGLGGDDVICGGDGNDTIFPGEGVDEVYGEAGSDRFLVGAGAGGLLDGGPGSDLADFSRVTAGPVLGDLATGEFAVGTGACVLRRVERVVGSPLDDEIRGDDRRNAIWGGPGADRLVGGGGPDRLLGGPGGDSLLGGGGDDLLRGGQGGDELHGQAQSDRLYGDAGPDALYGGPGADELFGDDGDLVLDGGGGEDLCRRGDSGPAAC